MNRNRKLSDLQFNHVSINNGSPDTPSNDATVELEPDTSKEFLDYSKTRIYQQLRPLLVCMRVFGLFHRRTVNEKGKVYMEPVVLHCFVVTFLHVINVVRSFTVYRLSDQFDNHLVQKLLFTIWSTECTFKASLLLKNCYKQNGIPKFFREWESVCAHIKLDKMCIFMMRKYIVVAFLFIIANSVVFAVILLYVPVLETIYLEVVWKDAVTYGNDIIFKVILSILAVLNSSSSMFPVSLFVVLSFAVGKRLKEFNDQLVTAIAADDFHGRIEDFRLRHQRLCGLVQILDDVFSPMLAVVYMANIPMFCLVLYTMVTTIDIHISLVFINLFWMAFILLQMAIVSITAAWINVKAHSPLEHIYSIRFSKTSNDIQLQMILFLNRLTATSVGVSVLNLFVVDKQAALGIVGMLVTYLVLLLEFQLPGDPVCNCIINITANNTFITAS